MPIDQYAPCPCGSGKKMKFCKCVDQPQEYEKLMRLMEGGQELAAMDRINQMLVKAPNSAWLLAIKGELLLGMQEFETFKENANRFLKLKPDNPLALIMKSMACLLDEESAEKAVHYLLEGLAESRESLPAVTLVAIELLIRSLESSDRLPLAGYWADLQQTIGRDQENEGQSVLQDPRLNLLVKAPVRLIEDPPGSPWKERLAEVLSLARTFRFGQAETKLRAILRDFPDQPGPLCQLLRAQLAQLNQSGAHATARKLAEHLGLSSADRAYFNALGLELEPEQKSLQPQTDSRFAEIDSVERIIEELSALEIANQLEGESAEQMKHYYAALVKDEVPAKSLFSILSGSTQAPETTDAETERAIVSSIATVVLFGKQTDKPARALFMATRFPAYQDLCKQILDVLRLGTEIELSEPLSARGYVEFLGRPRLVVGRNQPPSIEENGKQLVQEFLNLPLQLFGGATPLEAAQEERQRANLYGLLCHLEGEQGLVVHASAIDEIYQKLGCDRPKPKADVVSGGLRITNIIDLDRVDVTQLSDQHLQGVLLKALSLGASRVVYRSSVAVRARESLAHDIQTKSLALSALRMLAPSYDEKIGYCQELIATLDKAKLSVGKLIVELIGLYSAAGRPQDAEQALLHAAKNYPNDPYLLSFLDYLSNSSGASGPGMGLGADELAARMLHRGDRPEPASESGLVLPGQETHAVQGESKLWLPGS